MKQTAKFAATLRTKPLLQICHPQTPTANRNLDIVENAAVALVDADRELLRFAGTTESQENAAHMRQSAAWREFNSLCENSHVFESVYSWAFGLRRFITTTQISG